ncbi:glutamate receptor ionotropic, kainate 2-like [Bradysia coprophila]|uniref:glutamate receptor ionotropic, kainate 2-like n=1 Tax=Bradysia coprophila TaxID=38358 RepID=UPI00187D7280|nr:glutamate receptor ionotropic, kainate 2-like [Bradysia coprophila]
MKMKILIVVVLLVPITAGFSSIRIGGLFDNTGDISSEVFRYAASVANKKLADSQIEFDPEPIKIPYGNEFAASNRLCNLLKGGVSAVFGPSAPSSASHCMHICDAKEIPYIDMKWDADTKPPVVNMYPHPDAIANIFIDLVREWDWKGFTIVYESAPWLKRDAELLKLYGPKEHTVTVRRIDAGLDKTNYRAVLRRVKLSGDTNILLDCSIEALPEVLKQAQQVGLMTENHQFIITTMDMHTIDLEPYQYSGTNITGIRLVDPSNPIMEGITKWLTDLEPSEDAVSAEADSNEDPRTADGEDESESSTDPVKVTVQYALIYDGFLLLAEAFQQFNKTEFKPRRLSCSHNEAWEYGNSITNFMRNAVVQGLTGEVKFDNRGYRSSFAVDVIELTSSGIVKVGMWDGNLNIARPEPKESVATDDGSLKNTTFVVMISLTPPYGMLRDSATKLAGNERFEGFGIDLIHELSLMLGFKYEFRLQEDGKYGNRNNVTKDWDGMIGEVIHGRADLAITDLTITAEREGGVDFTMPFMNLGISILFKKPTTLPPSTFSFMSPFSREVWMYLGGAYLGVSLCLFVLGRISPSEWDNPYPCIEEPTQLENQFSVSNSLWFSIGALLQQGSEIAPKAPSTRAVASIWWFFTLIMVSSYTANLAAFLTSQPVTHVITSAEDLRNCSDPSYECPVEFGAKRDGSTINFFKEADDGTTFKNMYDYMKARPHLLTGSNNEGLETVLKHDKYAFLMESSSIEYLVERNCNVTQIGGLLDEKGYGIAMRKNSTYRSALSEAVLHLQEQGVLYAMKVKWWNEKKGGGYCSKKGDAGEAEELNMDNMYGVFFVLSVGSAFATVYGILEWLMVIFLRAKRQNLSFGHELVDELKFIVKCGGNTKTVRHRKSTSMNSRQSNGSHRSYNSADRDMK